jgi:hypothetical protein
MRYKDIVYHKVLSTKCGKFKMVNVNRGSGHFADLQRWPSY